MLFDNFDISKELKAFYKRFKGDMTHVVKYVPFIESEDLYRVKLVIDRMILAGQLKVIFLHIPTCEHDIELSRSQIKQVTTEHFPATAHQALQQFQAKIPLCKGDR
jgi:hypothetical protein